MKIQKFTNNKIISEKELKSQKSIDGDIEEMQCDDEKKL